MFTIYFIVLSLTWRLTLASAVPRNPLSHEFIELINKVGKWKAGRKFPPDTPMEYLRSLSGTYIDPAEYENVPVKVHDPADTENLPESFDARDKWPNCPSLNEIRDQGRCGSCWAFAPIETMTDRVCTYSNGTKNFHFSAEDLVTCIQKMFARMDHNGCFGSSPLISWAVWLEYGIVSGGNYNSHEGCKPYSIPTCPNHATSCTDYKPAPACVESCIEGYNVSYADDKKKGRDFYHMPTEKDIKAELYKNGPVTASFTVYQDFMTYKSGVYQHVTGDKVSGHSVKVIGWGEEDGVKYWLVANSWGTDFGENGFFKIRRGVDECEIEEFVLAGEPLLEDY